MLLGLQCLVCVVWFSTWCCALPPGPAVRAAYPAQVALGGFSAFSDTVCLTCCCAGGVGWAATLPFCYQCFSCTGWLAGVHWVLHLCQGAPIGVVTALWTTV